VQRVNSTDEFLGRMLESERAGAKALVVFMDDYPRNSREWTLLRQVQGNEAHNCALIGEQLKKRGRDYSHATGAFYDKAVAVQGKPERIRFLVKGLRWAVREFESALPGLEEDLKPVFARMRDSHLQSIAALEALLRS
jgi:nitronate monooxygenase